MGCDRWADGGRAQSAQLSPQCGASGAGAGLQVGPESPLEGAEVQEELLPQGV